MSLDLDRRSLLWLAFAVLAAFAFAKAADFPSEDGLVAGDDGSFVDLQIGASRKFFSSLTSPF